MKKIKQITIFDGLLIFILWVIVNSGIFDPIIFFPIAFLFVVLMFYISKRKIDFKISKKEIIGALWSALLLIVVTKIIYIVIFDYILNFDHVAANQEGIVSRFIENKNNIVGLTLLILFVNVFAPLFEELIFRGWIQQYFGVNKIMRFVISLVTFALIHLLAEAVAYKGFINIPPLIFWHSFYNYSSMAIVFCWIYYKYENIGLNIVFHSLNNIFATILILMEMYS